MGDANELCSNCKKEALPAKPKRGYPLAGLPQLYTPASKRWTATNILLVVNCAVFVLMVASGSSPILPKSKDLLRWGADYGPYTLGGQYWRLVTSAFVHIGIIHLLLNMYCLWRLAGAAEKLFRPAVIFGIYLLTGIGASLLSLSWNPIRVSAGASGALFGIIGVLISVLSFGHFELPDEQRRPMLGYVVKLTLYNLFYGLVERIDNMAHLGGLVTGLLMGMFLARAIVPEADEARRRELNVLAAGLIALSLITVPISKAKAYAAELGMGSDAVSKSDCASAVVHLKKYLASRPTSAQGQEPEMFARQNLAYCLYQTQQYEQAEQQYEQLLAANPNDRWALLGLATLNVGRNDAKAVTFFEAALRQSTLSAEEYLAYGQALEGVHRYKDSESALQKSIALQPNNPDARAILALVLALESADKQPNRQVHARSTRTDK